jgi:hypothetical protein
MVLPQHLPPNIPFRTPAGLQYRHLRRYLLATVPSDDKLVAHLVSGSFWDLCDFGVNVLRSMVCVHDLGLFWWFPITCI